MNNIIKRTGLGIYFIIIIAAIVVFLFMCISKAGYQNISSYILENILTSQISKFVLVVIGVALLAMSIGQLITSVSDEKDQRAISKKTEIGEIKVSLNSIESIALAAARKLSGIKDCKSYVLKGVEGVTVIIKVIVMADINIPTLSEDIQVKVKKTVEDISGIRVNEVKVVVDNIFVGYNKNRVE